MPFVKLDCGIIDSTVWRESAATSKTWITMLAMADSSGLVRSTAPGISARASLSLNEAIEAIKIFESPDCHSRSLGDEGRRIERVDGGYQILNYEKYRNHDYTATERQRRHRAAKRVTRDNRDKPLLSRKQKQSTEAEVLIPTELDTDGFRFAWKDWVQHRKEIKHPLTPTSIKQQLSHLSGIGEKRAIAAIRFTIRKGWQGLVEESTQRGNGQTEHKKPAPTGEAYQRVPMAREPTDEEFKAAAQIAKRETEALRSKLQK